MKRSTRRLVISLSVVGAVVMVVVIIVVAVTLNSRPRTEPVASGRVVKVETGTVTATVSADGSLQPARSASLDFATSGTVEAIDVEVGDHVQDGDVLAKLDDEAQRRAVDAAASRLSAARDSQDNLLDDNPCDDHPSGDACAAAEPKLASARADVADAESNLASAQSDLRATSLTSKMSGTVVAVNGDVGSSSAGGGSTSSGSSGGSGGGSSAGGGAGGGAAGGSAGGDAGDSGGGSGTTSGDQLDLNSGFVVIATTHTFVVDASFPEADAAKVKKGARATVTFPARAGGRAVTGTVTHRDLVGDGSSGVVKYGVEVELRHPPKSLLIGQTASVRVVTASAKDTLVVPSVALRVVHGKPAVLVRQGNRNVARTVTVGVRGDVSTQITSGLSQGDRVVITSGGPGGTENP